MRNSLTYDDIQLVPQYSTVPSRTQIDLKTLVSRRYGILNPIVASSSLSVMSVTANEYS